MKFPRHSNKIMKIDNKNLILFENNRKIFAQAMLEAGKEKTKEALKEIKDGETDVQECIRIPVKEKL